MADQMLKEFWAGEAGRWSMQNKDPLVGWYKEHNEDPNEEAILFRGIPHHVNSLALEYGCGPGRNIIKFKDFFARIDGADISKDILDKLPENLAESAVTVPTLYHTNGHNLPDVPDASYDVVFSIICMQHIGCRDWRLELYREFLRILKPGGFFTFQTGFGPGHPQSVDYFHNYDETDTHHRDTRVEDINAIKADLEAQGFTNFDFVITPPCHDVHPFWIWIRVQKPL